MLEIFQALGLTRGKGITTLRIYKFLMFHNTVHCLKLFSSFKEELKAILFLFFLIDKVEQICLVKMCHR